jgi:hypothetical protein
MYLYCCSLYHSVLGTPGYGGLGGQGGYGGYGGLGGGGLGGIGYGGLGGIGIGGLGGIDPSTHIFKNQNVRLCLDLKTLWHYATLFDIYYF